VLDDGMFDDVKIDFYGLPPEGDEVLLYIVQDYEWDGSDEQIYSLRICHKADATTIEASMAAAGVSRRLNMRRAGTTASAITAPHPNRSRRNSSPPNRV
jgi:hypothetical protein